MSEGLVQYVCERCHTRFVLALSGRELSPAKQLRAGVEAARRTMLHSDASYAENLAEATRRVGQAQADAEYERFRRSFNFCHNCRQFVCSDCWNDTNRQCLTCAPRKAARAVASRAARGPVAPTLEPDGPQIARPAAAMAAAAAGQVAPPQVKPRWPARTTLTLASVALALLIIALGTQQVADGPLAAHAADSPSPTAALVALGSPATAAITARPTRSPTAAPTLGIGLDPRVSTIELSTPELTATPTPAPTAAPTPAPTLRRTPAPTPKPTPAPLQPAFVCSTFLPDVAQKVTCQVPTNNGSSVSYQWFVSDNGWAYQDISEATARTLTYTFAKSGYYWIKVTLTRGTKTASSVATFTVRT